MSAFSTIFAQGTSRKYLCQKSLTDTFRQVSAPIFQLFVVGRSPTSGRRMSETPGQVWDMSQATKKAHKQTLLGGRFGYFLFFSARGSGKGESEGPEGGGEIFHGKSQEGGGVSPAGGGGGGWEGV